MKRLVTLLIFAVGLGATLILTPYAFGQESKSPVQAIWDAIYDLQNQDQRLQVQIDDLRAESGQIRQEDGLLSEISARVQVERGSELGHVTINVIVKNDGPEQAAGVKLTLFYKMSLFQLDSMPPDYCKYLERGIIQCDLGTMGSGDEVSILVTATELEMGVPTTITADVSSTTEDRVPSNNHAVLDIITGRGDLAEEGSRNEEQAATGVSDPQESNGSNNENAENGAGNQTGSRGGDGEMPQGSNNQTSSESSSDQDNTGVTSSEAQQDQTSNGTGENQQTSSKSDSSGDGDDNASADDGSQNETPSTGGNQTSSQSAHA